MFRLEISLRMVTTATGRRLPRALLLARSDVQLGLVALRCVNVMIDRRSRSGKWLGHCDDVGCRNGCWRWRGGCDDVFHALAGIIGCPSLRRRFKSSALAKRERDAAGRAGLSGRAQRQMLE
jgi:hypothetical protein